MGDLVKCVNEVTESEAGKLVGEYEASYTIAAATANRPGVRKSLQEAARIELGIRGFLTDGGFKGFTDTFEGCAWFGAIARYRRPATDGGWFRLWG